MKNNKLILICITIFISISCKNKNQEVNSDVNTRTTIEKKENDQSFNQKIFVSFESDNRISNHYFCCYYDTIFYNNSKFDKFKNDKTFSYLNLKDNLPVTVLKESVLFYYKYYGDTLINEQVFDADDIGLNYRKRDFYFNNNKLDSIRMKDNLCCMPHSPFPADYAKFLYDNDGRLEFVVLIIDKKIKHNDEKPDLVKSWLTRDDFDAVKIVKFQYIDSTIIESQYYLMNYVIKQLNNKYLNSLISKIELKNTDDFYANTTKNVYYTTPDNTNRLIAEIREILYPVYDFTMYGIGNLSFK